MGTNKRYPHLGMQRLEEREVQSALRAGPLQSLTAEQLRLSAQPVTVVPDNVRLWGHAWPDSCHLSADSAVVGRSALIFRGSGSAGYALTAAI